MKKSGVFVGTGVLAALLALNSAVLAGNTITVCWDGSGDYTTIQAGINAAANGDEVVVCPGTYYENISFGGKNIILTSTDPDNPSVVAATIIDAGGSGSVVTFSGSESTSCVLTGFTITNGYSHFSYAGQILGKGGGIRGNNTQATITNCRIINNRADGSYVEGGGLHRCNGTISNCVISGNRATASQDSWGGGLYGCNGDIINCEITNNVATGEAQGGDCLRVAVKLTDVIYQTTGAATRGQVFAMAEGWMSARALSETPSYQKTQTMVMEQVE